MGEYALDVELREGYGSVLALQNGHAIVGGPAKTNGSGAVYAFRYDAEAGVWKAPAGVEFGTIEEGHRFGSALLLAGTHMAVGAPGYEHGTGAVAIFEMDEETGTWNYDRRVAPFDARGSEQFGASLAFARQA